MEGGEERRGDGDVGLPVTSTIPNVMGRRGQHDVLLIVLSALVEHGVWRAVWTADHLAWTRPWPFVWLAGVVVGALAAWFLRPRLGALGALGIITFGCLMINDHRTLLGATLVNAGHHAFVPCLLALFAERLEPDGPSPSRYARVAAFLLALQIPTGAAPFLIEDSRDLGSIHAVCTLLSVLAALGVGSLRALPSAAAPMPPLAQSAYRGAAPKEQPETSPIADAFRLVAPLAIPAVVFAFIAAARPSDLSSASVADGVRPIFAAVGASFFLLGLVTRQPPSPLALFGVALFLAGGAWTLTSLPATWHYTDAGFMGMVSPMAPLATTYVVLAARGRAAIVVIAAWYALTSLAAFAGQSVPRHADWMVMVSIVMAALAIVSGVWCVRNAKRMHAKLDGREEPEPS